jgi:hypothetical protein
VRLNEKKPPALAEALRCGSISIVEDEAGSFGSLMLLVFNEIDGGGA